MSDYYDIQQVCLNGHQINSSYKRYPEYNKDYCDKCGEKTIYLCPNCNNPIRGYHSIDGVISFAGTPIPKNCEKCGKPFPWTERKMKNSAINKGGKSSTAQEIIENICSKFHSVAKQLTHRYDKRNTLVIKDEYDVQDLFHALLRIYFDDIRPEEWTPSYAGGSSRVDFLLKEESIVIEIKKTRDQLKDNKIGEQLIVDIEKYQTHPDCKTLICFVYDPEGLIRNPKGLENDLNKKREKIVVKTIIVPKA